MAHVFDTGLAAPQRTLIQDGVVRLLAGLERPTGYLQAAVAHGGVVRSWMDGVGVDMLAETLGGRAPAIGVAVGDLASVPTGTTGFIFKEELELLLYFVSNHARSSTSGRTKADAVAAANVTKDPGLHVMMAHAKELVIGQRCGLSPTSHPSIKQIRADREEELVTRPDLTIWLQTYKITTTLTIDPNRGLSVLLADIAVRLIEDPSTGVDEEAKLPDAATKSTTIDVLSDPSDP